MKPFFAMIAAAVGVVAWTPAISQAQDWPTYGSVLGMSNQSQQRSVMGPVQPLRSNGIGGVTPPVQTPIYTPGFGFTTVAPNGAIHYYYTAGRPSNGNDLGPTHYVPAYKTSREMPGQVYYYYGRYGSPARDYNSRR